MLKRDKNGRFVKVVGGPKKVTMEERKQHDEYRGGGKTPHYYHWPKGW
jgi:hypothetical protein